MNTEHVIVKCPHCNDYIFVYLKEFNCKIFRHGIYKKTLKQIDPHLPKKICVQLKQDDLIIGCGKPFRLIEQNGRVTTEICGYI